MSKTFRSALERQLNRVYLQQLKSNQTMYCPKINYCFSMDDIKKLNQEIRVIAENYEIDNGWFHENENRKFIDEQGNAFAIDVLGRFSQRFEPDYELHYVRLKKDGISFEFDVELFSEHI